MTERSPVAGVVGAVAAVAAAEVAVAASAVVAWQTPRHQPPASLSPI